MYKSQLTMVSHNQLTSSFDEDKQKAVKRSQFKSQKWLHRETNNDTPTINITCLKQL